MQKKLFLWKWQKRITKSSTQWLENGKSSMTWCLTVTLIQTSNYTDAISVFKTVRIFPSLLDIRNWILGVNSCLPSKTSINVVAKKLQFSNSKMKWCISSYTLSQKIIWCTGVILTRFRLKFYFPTLIDRDFDAELANVIRMW